MSYRVRIKAGENGMRRIYHKVISFIGHVESAGVQSRLLVRAQRYALSAAPSSFMNSITLPKQKSLRL